MKTFYFGEFIFCFQSQAMMPLYPQQHPSSRTVSVCPTQLSSIRPPTPKKYSSGIKSEARERDIS